MIDRRLMKKHRWDFNSRIMIYPELFYSEAFQSLTSLKTVIVLLRVLQKTGWDSKNKTYRDKIISFSHAEALALGISRPTFMRSIHELVKKGFIRVEYQGGQVGAGRDYSRYQYIEDWRMYGTNLFKPRTKARSVYTGSFDKHNQNRSKKTPVTHDSHTESPMTSENETETLAGTHA